MRRIGSFVLSAFVALAALPHSAAAQQGFAPELYGVTNVVIEDMKFDDPRASQTCNLSDEALAKALRDTLTEAKVPAVLSLQAGMPVENEARIQLVPEIWSHVDEMLGCVSWITVSAKSRVIVEIPPITAPRNVTVLYWRSDAKVFSSQTSHAQKVADVVKKVAEKFAQQYKLDQPRAPRK